MSSILDENFLYSTKILTKDHLACIGSVAIESTLCEREVEETIWIFLHLEEEQGKFITQGMPMKNRLELMLNLGKDLLAGKPNLIIEFTAIKAALLAAQEKRNIAIHGEWKAAPGTFLGVLTDGPEGYPPAKSFKRRLRDAPITLDTKELEETALRISNATYSLTAFVVEHFEHLLPPWPKKL